MNIISLLSILLTLINFALTEDVAHPNHRYFNTPLPIPQTPRAFQQSILNHLPQRITPQTHRRIQSVFPRNVSNQTSNLSVAKRSGDYHYMDYSQYDMEDHHWPHHAVHHVPAVRTIPYPRYPHYDGPSHRFDISSIGIIAILKLIIVKILSFGFFKIIVLFLMKIPIILFTLGFKFLIILKLIKLVKLLTIPIVIPIIVVVVAPIILLALLLLLPLLIPLILAPLIPLILIPILLPLLLSIPIPVLGPATTAGRRRRTAGSIQPRGVQEDVLYLVRRVLESEQCIERVACQFATNKQSKGFATFVAWYLEKAASIISAPRFSSYKDAYKNGTSPRATPQQCVRQYACNNPRNAL
uniref:Uncharacterized protein n=1 Tax=Homalodisca liturata TaxID=320908 RepID=A0A1B6J1U7_9HEMI